MKIMKMIETQIQALMQKVVQIGFEIALKTYQNLSSFAIVTDEDLTCFDIAINENLFFADMIAEKASDEEFWNTAEWKEELFCQTLSNLHTDLATLYQLIDDLKEQFDSEYQDLPSLQREFNTEYDRFFLTSCYQALTDIRTPQNQPITLFVHVTDFVFHQELFNIVKQLNDKKICQSYLAYYNQI